MPPVYPEWPKSPADLVPWPPVDGPKLKAFDFKGPQQIEFLNVIAGGLHSVVFRVSIHGQEYALKVFRFLFNESCYGLNHGPKDEEVRPLCYYTEPFNAECRAFGRLQETDYESLALPCHGYVLLDEEHEKTLVSRFNGYDDEAGTYVHFNGDGDGQDNSLYKSTTGSPTPEWAYDIRAAYPTSDGRRPPLRCILKTLGTMLRELNTATARNLLSITMQLQQLGIINLDLRRDNVIDGKPGDFSTAMTYPHFLMSPELNPNLTPTDLATMENELFNVTINDYRMFDMMIHEWNEECKEENKPRRCIRVRAFPDSRHLKRAGNGRRARRIWTHVDVRKLRNKAGTGRDRYSPPPRWYCDIEHAKQFGGFRLSLAWEIRQGHIFPVKQRH